VGVKRSHTISLDRAEIHFPTTKPAISASDQYRQTIRALSIQLTPENVPEIDSAAPKIKVEEARYPERLEKMTGL
jgi:hypothetical protein